MITMKELKELIEDGKTSDKKYKLMYKGMLVKVFIGDKDFSYFDILFRNKKKEEFHCCIHNSDLNRKDTDTLETLKMN